MSGMNWTRVHNEDRLRKYGPDRDLTGTVGTTRKQRKKARPAKARKPRPVALCTAITKNGQPCKNQPQHGTTRCGPHQ